MRLSSALLAILLLWDPTVSAGQSTAALEPGQKVRVVRSGGLYTVGIFSAMTADSITLLLNNQRPAALSLREPLRIEISRGMQPGGLRGAAKGGALGFGYGAVLTGATILTMNLFTAALQHEFGHDPEWWPARVYLRSVATSGLVFGTVGAVIGGLRHGESWQKVRVPGTR